MVKAKRQSMPVAKASVSSNAGKEFFMAAANMSWQLAIVVLVPILGGFQLDKLLGSLPGLTIVGFSLAMIGMAVVVWQNMQLYTPTLSKNQKRKLK